MLTVIKSWFGVGANLVPLITRSYFLRSVLAKLLQLDRPLLKLLRLRRILRTELAAYVETMHLKIRAVAEGEESLTAEQVAAEWLKLREYQQLLELCDAPLRSQQAQVASQP